MQLLAIAKCSVLPFVSPSRVKPEAEQEIPKEEKDKYQEEFLNFQQDLDKKKEEFQKEHTDVQGQPCESEHSFHFSFSFSLSLSLSLCFSCSLDVSPLSSLPCYECVC